MTLSLLTLLSSLALAQDQPLPPADKPSSDEPPAPTDAPDEDEPPPPAAKPSAEKPPVPVSVPTEEQGPQEEVEEEEADDETLDVPSKGGLLAAEFRNNAHTLNKGDFVIHPILQSSWAPIDHLEVKTTLAHWIIGPHFGLEYGVFSNDSVALSIEPTTRAVWGFSSLSYGGHLRTSFAVGDNALHVSGGFLITDEDDNPETWENEANAFNSIPINVGYDISTADDTTWRLIATSEIALLTELKVYGTLGANWNKALSENTRLALGVALVIGALPLMEELDRELPTDMPDAAVMPCPTFELWWRI